MTSLHVGGNNLSVLPDSLPQGLTKLHVGRNNLSVLPDSLPRGLTELHVANNQLASIPPSVLRLSNRCTVTLNGNPISERVMLEVMEIAHAPGYAGPRIEFDRAGARAAIAARPLSHAITDWHTVDDAPSSQETAAGQARRWALAVALPEGAPANDRAERALQVEAFSGFLDRLRNTVNFRNPRTQPTFRASVTQWLDHLLSQPELLALTLVISQGATTSCEDRVSRCFNDMQDARLGHDVAQGHYDHRAEDLVPQLRRNFRKQMLNDIAAAKVKSLRTVDEMEVYLGYTVKLNQALNLGLSTDDMRHYSCSGITESDLHQAETEVKQAESEGFVKFLVSESGTWDTWLKRRDETSHQQVQVDMVKAVETKLGPRIQAELQVLGMVGDASAEAQVGRQITQDLAFEEKAAFTRRALAQQPELLESPWSVDV